MPVYEIAGIPVNFPFEPYDVQRAYMTKVIECLETSTHGILESPTGTGKTLSLLCSTLGWISEQKSKKPKPDLPAEDLVLLEFNKISSTIASKSGFSNKSSIPKVIYSSRTHSQLVQAMNELKRTSYSHMKAVVLGSRDQLCIHPDVSKEQSNAIKVQLCKMHILLRSCSFYNNVEKNKDHSLFQNQNVLDIEDLVTAGRKLRTCPYFMSKEFIENADIVFMPYNYLLDPKARKSHNINLENTIVILDEAHNIEKICEDAASAQLKSSDIALAINDLTHIMKILNDDSISTGDEGKDFTIDDLALIKELVLEVEKLIDEVQVKREGSTYPSKFLFELLAKANIHKGNFSIICKLLENLIQFLQVGEQQKSSSDSGSGSAFQKGRGLERLLEFLSIVFVSDDESMDEKIFSSFKVHFEIEETKTQKNTLLKDGWITPKGGTTSTKLAKIVNYWCLNPGFGMNLLTKNNVRSIILTSGTLAPLKPLIMELGLSVSNFLENPHVIDKSQVCVKIVPFGPDREPLNSSYQNRDNPKYIASLGRTILTFSQIIPDGLLVFFPSYPLMYKCRDSWQASGTWSQICKIKPIFVEPKDKDSFNSTMLQYYEQIKSPTTRGACFMAVCRGKVSEGLDFVDANGRAVIITGLPYPPLKDPKVILKRQYLEQNRTKDNELISGDAWYGLEATRAVNQAIGRIIRHKYDYGAILLCDSRFNNYSQKSQLSSWIQGHLKSSELYQSFGPFIGELSRFFRNAKTSFSSYTLSREVYSTPKTENINIKSETKQSITSSSKIEINNSNAINSWSLKEYAEAAGSSKMEVPTTMDFVHRLNENVKGIDFNSSCDAFGSNSCSSSSSLGCKRERSDMSSSPHSAEKKKKFKVIGNTGFVLNSQQQSVNEIEETTTESLSREELLKLIKNSLAPDFYRAFLNAVRNYRENDDINKFFHVLSHVFSHKSHFYLLKSMRRFIRTCDKSKFDEKVINLLNEK